nr:hypothetical protein [Candidatus Sigynarchaeum springense]
MIDVHAGLKLKFRMTSGSFHVSNKNGKSSLATGLNMTRVLVATALLSFTISRPSLYY